MNLTDDELRGLYYCVAEVRENRTEVKPWLQHLYDRLEDELRMSRLRHGIRDDGGEFVDDVFVTARQAGVTLGLTKRQVHRIAEKLAGDIVDGRWLFKRSNVEAYARERKHDGPAGGTGGVAPASA